MSEPKENAKEKTPKKQKVAGRSALNVTPGSLTDEDSVDDPAFSKEQQEPEDVVVLKAILDSMGVEKYEPRVIPQLLEFVHRYTTDVLVDAQEYSTYANKPAVDADDIRLAAMSRLNHTYAQMPSRELMMELAEKRNAIPLPPIPSEYGVRLPLMEHQLTTESIRLFPNHPNQFPNPAMMQQNVAAHPVDYTPSPNMPRGTRNIKVSASPIQIKLGQNMFA
ncbi:hypothetical protein LEN26_015108 [Aphanomyces euteiches]|nr:hypothetical protein LEN26_015108 [Aphanomyces euteiches]KAH9106661.1 hypothetical protein AeMF1_017801 [Aphanomyces euteiches]KAH9196009.1 hypothetical protein AeNC1_001993 [Aphanomyces euteiches]